MASREFSESMKENLCPSHDICVKNGGGTSLEK